MKVGNKTLTAKFLSGADSVGGLKAPQLTEIAIIGRSNVGKSSLLNRLTNNTKLTRVSSTPGRTQQINLFEVSIKGSSGKPKRIILADLPGFGYAKLSHQKRSDLVELLYSYLTSRKKLSLVVLLNDCRRLPEKDELEIQKIAFNQNLKFIVAVTKGDKLKQSEIKPTYQELANAYHLEKEDIILTGEKITVAPLWERIFLIVK